MSVHIDASSSPLVADTIAAALASGNGEADLVVQPSPIDSAIEEDNFDDGESALGADSPSSSTSLTSSILNYQYENGRRYHSFRGGHYLLPNDECEQDRLDFEHHVFCLVLNGELFRAPITKNPQRVLDMGTGTGVWAMEFADQFPSAVVLGNDLSPIQPSWVPPNCSFIIDDLESDWLYKHSEKFDFIHGRAICGSIKDWPRLYNQIFKHLKPGAWVEMQEYDGVLHSDEDPDLLNVPTIAEWQKQVDEATTRIGLKLDVAKHQKQYLMDAGFVDIQDDMYKVPCGRWAREHELKTLGSFSQELLVQSVEPYTLAIYKQILKWEDAEVEVLMAKLRSEFRDRRNKIWSGYHFVYGRKPV